MRAAWKRTGLALGLAMLSACGDIEGGSKKPGDPTQTSFASRYRSDAEIPGQKFSCSEANLQTNESVEVFYAYLGPEVASYVRVAERDHDVFSRRDLRPVEIKDQQDMVLQSLEKPQAQFEFNVRRRQGEKRDVSGVKTHWIVCN